MTTPSLPVLRVACAAVLAAVVSGCALTPTDAQWTEADATVKENQVLFLRESYDVRFESGADHLSADEQKRLGEYLDRSDVGIYDDITLAVADDGGPDSTLAARRQAAVAAYLRTRYLKAAFDPAGGAPLDQVTVVVGRYIVVPPNCPDWRKPADQDPQNTPASNLGCATTTNLGLMVADPHDLIAGKERTSSDAENNAYAIQRYRQGYYKVPNAANERVQNEFAKGTGIPDEKK